MGVKEDNYKVVLSDGGSVVLDTVISPFREAPRIAMYKDKYYELVGLSSITGAALYEREMCLIIDCSDSEAEGKAAVLENNTFKAGDESFKFCK